MIRNDRVTRCHFFTLLCGALVAVTAPSCGGELDGGAALAENGEETVVADDLMPPDDQWLQDDDQGGYRTASATQSSGVCQLPASTRGRIGRAQVWVQGIADKKVLVGKRDYVWADNGDALPGIFTSVYIPYDRDFDRSHTVAWYQDNRPDWVVYKCDGKTPAHYQPRYSWGYYTPVDITRLDTRQELFAAFVDPKLKLRHFDGVSLDNVSLRNGFGRCGVWRNGQWVQQYSDDDQWDPRFTSAVIAWLRFATRYAHKRNLCTTANIKYAFRPHRNTYASAAYSVDIVLDETGFHRAGQPTFADDEWVERMTTLATIAKYRGLVIIDKAQTSWDKMTSKLVNASIASYMLIKGDHSYLAILAEDDPHRFFESDQLFAEIGEATSPLVRAGHLYRRFFKNAIAMANPSSTEPAYYTLNNTSRWSYLGQDITGKVKLAPGEARLIMRSSQ